MGQFVLLPVRGPEAADGGFGVFRLQPVGKELENLPLRPLIAPLTDIGRLGDSRQPQQVQGLGPLLGAQKIRGGGDVPP